MMEMDAQGDLFVDPMELLVRYHYLGPGRGTVYQDGTGVIVSRSPSSRWLPVDWIELSRWCIVGTEPNAGSQMFARWVRWLREHRPDVTTVVSYSDPAAGHDGALYRACNWLWAPTWHRLRPPPTGLGQWTAGGKQQSVKDRWIFPLRPDPRRIDVLAVKDTGLRRRYPFAEYREPRWKRGRPTGGGGDWRQWQQIKEAQ